MRPSPVRPFTAAPAGALALAAALAALALPALARQGGAAPAAKKPPAAAKPKPAAPAKKGAATDYLVTVGKHVMWKSQVEKMHPELAKQAVRVSKANRNDFPVTVGKTTVMASTLRRDPQGPTRPASHDRACRDFLVQSGKRAVWASAANCPMGEHKGDAKPLCCVAPLAGGGAGEKALPRCCQDAAAQRAGGAPAGGAPAAPPACARP